MVPDVQFMRPDCEEEMEELEFDSGWDMASEARITEADARVLGIERRGGDNEAGQDLLARLRAAGW